MSRLDLSNVDWYSVLPRLGIDAELIANPKKLGMCPIEGDGKTRFRFANNGGTGLWHCNQCGHGDGVSLVAKVNGVSNSQAIFLIKDLLDGMSPAINLSAKKVFLKPQESEFQKEKRLKKVRMSLQRTWSQGQSLTQTNTPAWIYLQRRVPGLQAAWLSHSLLAHASLYHWDEETEISSRHHGLIARALDLKGTPSTIHRTYLSADGYKAPVSPSQVKKMMTGVRVLNGDSVWLNRPEGNSKTILVCEGIETGLSLVARYKNRYQVCAALSAGNLSKVKVCKDRFDRVILAVDKDPVNATSGYRIGEHYGLIAAKRLREEGFSAIVKMPFLEGDDFADIWLKICKSKEHSFAL